MGWGVGKDPYDLDKGFSVVASGEAENDTNEK